jgi:hypothetical protein
VRQLFSILAMLGLLAAGFEGAIDAVDVAHDQDPSGMHEEHHAHTHADDPAQPGDTDAGSHQHTCHCGLHVPPLFLSATAIVSQLRHVRPLTEPALHALALEPPPLPPPIA